MAIAGVETGYSYQSSFYQKTRQTTVDNFYGNISSASELTEENNDSKILGLTMIPEEGSNITYGMRAQYAAESTDDDPIVQVTSNYGGKAVSYNVHINDVDPRNASQLEMFALCSYADDKGISDSGTFGSYQKLKYYSLNAQDNGYCSGLNGTDSFVNTKFNWEGIVTKMMDNYLSAGAYNQYQDGNKLLAMFHQFKTTVDIADSENSTITDSTEEDSSDNKPLTREEMMQKLHVKINEIYKKIQNGDTEPTYQIGGQTYTEKEWDKLLEKFDSIQEAIRSVIEKENEAKKDSAESKSDISTIADIKSVTDTDKTDEVSESAIEYLVSETSKCTYPTENKNEEKTWYITCYTEEGILCRKYGPNGEEDNLWEIKFTDASQYQEVMGFLNRFDKDENLTFASHKNFWNDFLAGEMDENDFEKIFKETKDGIPDYTMTIGDSMYIDKEKVKYAKYMNPFGNQIMTREEMLAFINTKYKIK